MGDVCVTLDLRIQVKMSSEADVEWALSDLPSSRLVSAEHSGSCKSALELIAADIIAELKRRLTAASAVAGGKRGGVL